MAINDVMGLTVELEANTTKFMKDLRAATKGIDLGFNAKPMIRQFAQAQNHIQKILSATVADAATSGFSLTNLKGLTKKLTSVSDQMMVAQKQVFDLNIKMGREAAGSEAKLRMKAQRDLHEARLGDLDKEFQAEQKSTDRIMGQRKKAISAAKKILARDDMKKVDAFGSEGMGKAGESFGEGIGKAFGDLKSGNLGGLLKSAGGGATSAGKGMLEKAEKGGVGNEMLGKLGGMMTKIGPAIAAIGALVAGLAAVVAVVVAADSAMKGLNKTLMDSGVAGADLANQYGVLGTTLDDISTNFASAFTLNNVWGTTAKDHLEIIGSFASAGVTFKRMKGTVAEVGAEMNRLQEYTEAALTYSKLLGMSTQEVSSTMATYMEELGLTLEGVKSRFANITAAAKESGFSTKRFFNMVLQATSGMSMYNVRLEEAAGLLINLGKILGQKMGGDFLQNLMKGFKDESTQDRIKKTMTTGVKLSASVLKKDAVRSAEEFARKLDTLGKKDAGGAAGISGLLEKFKLVDPSKDPEKFARQLGKMSPKQLGMLSAAMSAQGGSGAGMSRSLVDLATKGQAFKDTRGGVSAARASAGGGATLYLQLNEAQKALEVSLDQIDLSNAKHRKAFETITGKSGEAAEQLRRVGMSLRGQYDLIQKAKKEGPKAITEFNRRYADEFGVRINETTKKLERIVTGDDGQVTYKAMGQSLQDFFLGFGDKMLGGEAVKVSEDILLAQDIAANTTEMSKLLEQGVEVLLAGIYDSVQYIAGMMGKGLDGAEKSAKTAAIAQLSDEAAAARRQQQSQSAEIGRLQKARKTASPEERSEIDRKIAGHMKAKGQAANILAEKSTGMRAIGRITDEHKVVGEDASNVKAWLETGRRASRESNLKKLKKKMGKSYDTRVAEARDDEGDVGFSGLASGYALKKSVLEGEQRVRSEQDKMLTVAKLGGVDTRKMADQMGEFHITDQQADDARQKRMITAEQRTAKEESERVIAGIESISAHEDARQLALQLQQLGGGGSAGQLMAQAEALLQGKTPEGVDLDQMVFDPASGQKRRMGDMILGHGSVGRGGLLKEEGHMQSLAGGPGSPANDMLLHIGQGGRVKFAQRISAADQVTATAAKPGGPVSQAKGSGGGIVINSFGNSAEVIRGIQAAVAAGVLN